MNRLFNKLTKSVCLVLYYGIGNRLPSSTAPIIGQSCRRFRALLCNRLFSESGKNVNVESGAYFGSGAGISLGDESGIGLRCSIRQPVVFGKYVMMGPEVMIYRTNHSFDRLDIPMMHQGGTSSELLVVMDDVWIGARSLILPSCRRIGTGSIIAAGSVVTQDVPDFSIVGGNPARVIKMRTISEQPLKVEEPHE